MVQVFKFPRLPPQLHHLLDDEADGQEAASGPSNAYESSKVMHNLIQATAAG